MKKTLLIILLVITITGIYGVYLFNKEPKDIRDAKADFEIDSSELIKEFATNEEGASKKYLDKILTVTGHVREVDISSASVFMEGSDPLSSITCSFYPDELDHLKNLKAGDEIQVKGKCTGKLMDIVMNNCSLNNSNKN